MKCNDGRYRLLVAVASGGALALSAFVAGTVAIRAAKADFPWFGHRHAHVHAQPPCPPAVGEGAWFWMRSPTEERQAIMSFYNRYCIRCHGVDGRGVWDIPGVPDFSNALWQAAHSEPDLVYSIIEGRGGVMPPFRGTITLEEAWGMARYLRTFVPGTEVSRPASAPARPAASGAAGNSRGEDPKPPAAPAPDARGPF